MKITNRTYYTILFTILLLFVVGLLVMPNENVATQTNRNKKVSTIFAGAGVSYGGYITVDSLASTKATDMFDVSWIKGKTWHTFISLTSPAATNGDTCRVVFDGAIQLSPNGSDNLTWFPIDSISTIKSTQSQSYVLYVNSFAGRFDFVRLRVVNTTTATAPYTNRSGKTLDWFITSDGTNYPNYYTGGMWH